MNKHLYRIIFNERRGQLMVVAANVIGLRKAASGESVATSGSQTGACFHGSLRGTCFSLCIAFGTLACLAGPVSAQIVANPNAPGNQRATVLQTSNGVALVNIQTPSAAGVSHNVYSQFDVTGKGAVLNNSRTDVQSQIGGWVQGNPWLAGGSARVILNEVNSANPSKLNGYLEIAGQRAELVVANPSGVNVDGGGFINASRVTLTTGQPIMSGGNLNGYLVERGTVRIDGQGMDAAQADYAAIIGRAVQVNAGIWAKELQVVTGAQKIIADTSPAAVTGVGMTPLYALDVAHLGGMYAGKISLIGTEAGLGMRNAGTLVASSGNLVLDMNGWLSNSGNLQGTNTVISTTGDIRNDGAIYAAGDAHITSGGNVSTNGIIAAKNHTTVLANGATSGIVSGETAVIAAGMNADGSLGATGNLHVQATTTAALNGTVAAAHEIDVTAGQLTLSAARVSAREVMLTASNGDLNASQAEISSQEILTLSAKDTVRTDAALVQANRLSLHAQNLSNVGGQILQSGSGDLDIMLPGLLDNSTGQVASNSDNLNVNAGTLINAHGVLTHAGSGTLNIKAETLIGQQGQINGNGLLKIQATEMDHRGARISAQQIALTVSNLDNGGGVISQTGTGHATLSVQQRLNNSGGLIESAGDADIDAGTLQNRAGRITSAGAGAVTSGILDNTGGAIAAGTTLAVTSDNFDNSGGTLQALGGAATLRATDLKNAGGSIYARSNLDTIAGAIDNSGRMYALGKLDLAVSGSLTNRGVIAAQGDVSIGADSLDSATESLLGAGLTSDGAMARSGNLNITTTRDLAAHGQNLGGSNVILTGASLDLSGSQTNASEITLAANGGHLATSNAIVSTAGTLGVKASHAIDNTGGVLSAGQLSFQAVGLNNTHGTIIQTGAGDTEIKVSGDLINTAGRVAVNSSDLSLRAGTLVNIDGTIEHAGSGVLSISAASINSMRGAITSNGSLNLDAETLNHDGARTSAQTIDLKASSLSNRAGHLMQRGDGAMMLSINDQLDNTSGEIAGAGALKVKAGALGNNHGRITSTGAANVRSTVDLNNRDGVIAATEMLTVSTAGLDNTSGTVQSTHGALIVDTDSLLNSRGRISSGTTLTATATGEVRNDGVVYSGHDQTLHIGGAFFNTGSVAAHGDMTLSAGSLHSGTGSLLGAGINSDGSRAQTGRLDVRAVDALHLNGDISAAGNAVLRAASINLAGSEVAAENIGITAMSGNVSTTGARIGTAGILNVTATDTIDNREGSLTAGQLMLDAENLNNVHGVITQSGGADTNIAVTSNLDNTSGHIAVNSENLTLRAGTLRNTDGKMEHAGTGRLFVDAATVAGQHGQITSNGNLNIASGDIDHRGAVTTAQRIKIAATNLDNSDGRIAQIGNGTADITSSANLRNSSGTIESNGGAVVAARTLDNSGGRIAALSNVGVTASYTLNNSAGVVAAGTNLTVSGGDVDNASGKIEALSGDATLNIGNFSNVAGEVHAAGNLHTSAMNVTNTGKLYATGDQVLDASGTLVNAGTIAAEGSTIISAYSLASGSGSLLAGGVKADGTMANTGNLRVTAAQALTASGQNFAAGSVNLSGGSVDVSGSQTSAADLLLSARTGGVTTSGAVVSTNGTLAVSANQSLVNTGGILSAGQLIVDVAGMDNTQGKIIQTGVGDTAIAMSGTLDNTAGHIKVNSTNLTLGAGTLRNTLGTIEHAGTGRMDIDTEMLDGAQGSIVGNGGVNITTNLFNHDHATTSGQNLTIAATILDNRAGQLLQSGVGSMTLGVTGRLNNAAGEIGGNGALRLQAAEVDNSDGSIVSGDSVTIKSRGTLNNTAGTINAAHAVSISSDALDNTHGIIHAGDGALALSAANLVNRQGSIIAGTDLTMSIEEDLHNDGMLYAGRDQSLSVGDTFTNAGFAAAQRHLTLAAGSVRSGEGSLLGAGAHVDGSIAQTGNLTVRVVDISNLNGTNIAGGNAVLTGGSISLASSQTHADNIVITATNGNVHTTQARIGTPGTLSISAARTLDNNSGNLSAGQLMLSAVNLSNDHGTVIQGAAGDTNITMTGALDNTSGRIAVNSDNLTLDAGALVNIGGAIEHAGTGVLAINAGMLSGRGGAITGNGSIAITAGDIDHREAATSAQRIAIIATSLDNRDGEIVQLGHGSGGFEVSGNLDNRGGEIDSYGDSTITAASVDNGGGRIAAVGNVGVNAGISLSNINGFIAAGTNLSVSGGNVGNAGGSLQAQAGDATLNIESLNNTGGSVYANHNLSTTAAVVNNAGTMYAAGSQSLTASGMLVNSGTIAAQRNTTISANQLTSGTGSLLAAGIKVDGGVAQTGDLTVSAASDIAAHGQTVAAGSASLMGSSVNLSGSQTSAANIALHATAGNVTTTDAQVASTGSLSVSASQSLVNSRGTLSSGQLAIDVADLDNSHGTIVQTGAGDTAIAMHGTLDNTVGRIASNSANLMLGATTLVNTGGSIEHAGAGNLNITASTLNDARGQITANGHLHIAAAGINHTGASTIAQQITISTADLDNRQGEITQLGSGTTTVGVSGTLDNRTGIIASNGATMVAIGNMANQGGVVQAAGTATLNVAATGTLDNSNGEVAGGGSTAISGNDILNQLGLVSAGGTLNATAVQGIDNLQGLMAGSGSVTLASTTLDNTGGKVVSVQGNANVATTGAIGNNSGVIQAAGDVLLQNGGLNNTQAAGYTGAGTIVGNNVTVWSGGQGVDNHLGTIAATLAMDINSAALNNDAGLLQGGTAVQLRLGTLTNTNAAGYELLHPGSHGGIASGGALSMEVGNWNNAGGLFSAEGDILANASYIDNTQGGRIVGGANVVLGSTGLDNRNGQIEVLGDLVLNNAGHNVDNRQGLIRVGRDLSVNAEQIDNRDTGGIGQGIEARTIALSTPVLLNGGGIIRADQDVRIVSSDNIDNSHGLISAYSHLGISNSSSNSALAITNTAGTMIGGDHTSITAGSISGDGRLLSLGDLNLNLSGNYSLTGAGEIAANGDASLHVGGDLYNAGQLQAGGTLAVTARNIENAVGGDVSGHITRLSASDTLTNRGLIDGVHTELNAVTLDNLGTGRIYGDYVSIAADLVNNDAEAGVGATIAARERLDIGAQIVNNREHALLLSGGNMAIGRTLDAGRIASGRADVLNNYSATIEALGDLRLAATEINNKNVHFTTEVIPGGPIPIEEWSCQSGNGYQCLYEGNAGGTNYPDTYEVFSTDPARIVSGGAMDLDAANILNDNSKILAGGKLSIGTARLHNSGSHPEHAEYLGNGALVEQGSVPGMVIAGTVSGSPTATGLVNSVTALSMVANHAAELVTVNNAVGQQITNVTGSAGPNSTNHIDNADAGSEVGGATGAQATSDADTGGPDAVAALAMQPSSAPGESRHADKAVGVAAHHGALSTGGAATAIRKVDGSQADSVAGSGQASQADLILQQSVSVEGSTGATARSATAVGAQTVVRIGDIEQISLTNPAGGAQVVRSSEPNTRIPSASLYVLHPTGSATYLIETDPRFANYRQWLGSDYMLDQLQLDHSVTQKRLGDAYYEQSLVREQVAQLTGRRYLGDFTSDDDEYRALMDAGITYAKSLNLRPGIALSAAQMAALSSDIVWMVETDVTLGDGSTQKVLVPRVYVRVRDGDIDGSGSLLAGKEVNIQATGNLVNTGSIGGRDVVKVTADNLNNLGGRITGDSVIAATKTDLNNIGGTISANTTLVATAGRDLNIETTTRYVSSASGNTFSGGVVIDRVAGLYVNGEGANGNNMLLVTAGRDANLVAAQIGNAGEAGMTGISAARDLNLKTVSTYNSSTTMWDRRNYRTDSTSSELGSQIHANGAIMLTADADINARAADVQAGTSLTAVAGNDIKLVSGVHTVRTEEAHQTTKSGFLRSKTTTKLDMIENSTALGTSFAGDTVSLVAGNNIKVVGSAVAGDNDVSLVAGKSVTVTAATNTITESHHQSVKEKGFLSGGGGFGISFGTRNVTTDQNKDATVQSGQARSLVGSLGGNLSVSAGDALKISGSDLSAGQDMTLIGKSVEVTPGVDAVNTTYSSKITQTGITLAAGGSVVNAVQTAQAMNTASAQTSSGSLKALAAAVAGMTAIDTINDFNEHGPSVKVSLTAGRSENESTEVATSRTHTGSVLSANNVAINATGAGKASNIDIVGSDVRAVGNVTLVADNQVNLLAAQDSESQHSTSKSKSAAVGIAAEFSVKETAVGFTASASASRGNVDGESATHLNAHVSAGDRLTINSGGDTNLRGAVASGRQVVASIGGDLNIESLQDTAKLDGKRQTVSISGTTGPSAGLSGSVSQSKVNNDYASVQEQSGIRAGDGGFQIAVADNTELKGAVISSSKQAIEDGRNSLVTAGLLYSDILNRSSTNASGASLGINVGKNQSGNTFSPSLAPGAAQVSNGHGSTTQSGISSSTLVVESQPPADQIAHLDRDISTDKDAVQALTKGWNGAEVLNEVSGQMQVANIAMPRLAKAIGDYADTKRFELNQLSNTEEAAKWAEGGIYRVAAHTVLGTLGGGLNGGIGAAATAESSPILDKIQGVVQSKLLDTGLNSNTADAAVALITGGVSGAIGGLVGGSAGAATGLNMDTNNRQLHPGDQRVARILAAKSEGKFTEAEIQSALRYAGLKDKDGSVIVGEETREVFVDLRNINSGVAIQDTLKSDPSLPLTVGDARTLLENAPSRPSNELIDFIVSGTGGANSPYILTRNTSYASSLVLPVPPTGTTRATMLVDGVAYNPLVAQCPATSCAGGDMIAYAIADPGTNAYSEAVARKIEKDINVATAVFSVGGAVISGVSTLAQITKNSVALTRVAESAAGARLTGAVDTTKAPAGAENYGVSFFGGDILPFYGPAKATIGNPNGAPTFFMSLEDAAAVKNAHDAAVYTGMAPSAQKAYLSGTDVYGFSFPIDGLQVAKPTLADAAGWPHFLEGGTTAVKLEGPNAGYMVTRVKEFVTSGSNAVPKGSVLFQIGAEGEWIPIRQW